IHCCRQFPYRASKTPMKMRRLLMLLLWLPTLAFAQQPYYGTTASSIRLEGASPSELDRIVLRTGDIITPENVRAAIQALFDTGLYRSVNVDAASAGNGTSLTFHVAPHYYFSTVKLKPESLLGRPLTTLVRVPVGQKFSESQVQEIAKTTQEMLKESGYFGVNLTIRSVPDDDHHLQTIEFDADTDVKNRAKIAAVDIKGGEGTLPPSQLRDAFHVSVGARYSASEMDKGVSEIQKKFLKKNFLNIRVEAVPQYDAATNTVRIGVTITPGQETVIDTGKQTEI